MENPLVSIIVVFTREDQLAEATKWVNAQSIGDRIEFLPLDNRANKSYTSAAQALNDGAEKAQGEYLIFMHQDLYLWDLRSAEKYVEFLREHPDSVIGVAGVTEEGDHFYDIWQTTKKYRFERPANGQVMPVVALDECMFAMTKKRWAELRFDEETCDNWHFYGADICIENRLHGGCNYLVPLEVCHESLGTPDKSFRKALKKVILKYRGRLDRLLTNCVDMKCTMGAYRRYVLREKFKSFLRKIGLFDAVKRRSDARRRKKGEYLADYDDVKAARGE